MYACAFTLQSYVIYSVFVHANDCKLVCRCLCMWVANIWMLYLWLIFSACCTLEALVKCSWFCSSSGTNVWPYNCPECLWGLRPHCPHSHMIRNVLPAHIFQAWQQWVTDWKCFIFFPLKASINQFWLAYQNSFICVLQIMFFGSKNQNHCRLKIAADPSALWLF